MFVWTLCRCDGRLRISGSESGCAKWSDYDSVHIWDVDTGVCEAVIMTDDINAIAELLDGRPASSSGDSVLL